MGKLLRTTKAVLIVALCIGLNAKAETNLADGQYHKIQATAYCDCINLTATGTKVRPGIAAFDPKYYGYVALIYDSEMNFLGYYEILDTGSDPIKSGEVIDIWMESKEECIQFGRQDVFIFLVKGQG